MKSITLVLADQSARTVCFEEHLSKGRAFVPGVSDVGERESCELILESEGRTYALVGEVVHARTQEPGRGVGLALNRLDTSGLRALRAFIDGGGEAAAPTEDGATGEGDGDAGDEDPSEEARIGAASLHERIRSLSGAEQQRLAAGGTLGERTALERMYGPTVWETLLRNARLTIPEVARIARKGSLPRPLVELVAANAPWVASGEVQRALLSNPRSSPAVVQKVLGGMSRRDLMLVPQQTAYPEAVRAAAKKRLGR